MLVEYNVKNIAAQIADAILLDIFTKQIFVVYLIHVTKSDMDNILEVFMQKIIAQVSFCISIVGQKCCFMV